MIRKENQSEEHSLWMKDFLYLNLESIKNNKKYKKAILDIKKERDYTILADLWLEKLYLMKEGFNTIDINQIDVKFILREISLLEKYKKQKNNDMIYTFIITH